VKPAPRRLISAVALSATALSLIAPAAEAIVVARVTRHGYILTDDPADPVYGENLPVTNTREMYTFIYEATTALSEVEGFHQGRYLATMQLPSTQQPLAFYLPIRNDVRGIGQRSSTDTRAEVFDNNRALSTAFPLDGFLYLNSLRFYTDPRSINFGRYLICTQEFGHRYGPRLEITPFPQGAPDAGTSNDAGIPDDAISPGVDASLPLDAAASDASPASDAVATTDAGATADAATQDGATPDGAVAPMGPLTRDALLGRGNEINGMTVNRAHWSYFFNTGGSPMEGNLWTEIAPGEFRTERPSFRFSDFDLYNMGLVPASAVRPTFLITNATQLPRNVDRDTAPEYSGRQVTIRGRRVEVSIDDVIAANGRRSPAYPDTPRDLDVVWVLWVQPDQVDDDLAAEFDQAIESCALGYDTASGNLSRLVATTPYVEPPDAGPRDAGPADTGAPADTGTPDAGTPDAGDVPLVDDAAPLVAPRAQGGCACSTTAPTSGTSAAPLAALGLALALVRRRRRASGARVVVPSVA